MEHLSYLFAAYSFIFGALALYVMFLWRCQARLDSRLRVLEAQLNEIRAELAEDRPKPIPTTSRTGS